jgi:hypothetical protein
MRRLLAVILFCAGMFCLTQSNAQFNGCPPGFCNGSPSSTGGPGFSSPRTSSATYTAQGVHFNGSTELWNPSGLTVPLTGSVDGKKGTLSMWVREGVDGTTDGIMAASSSGSSSALQIVRISGSNYWREISQNAAGSNILFCGTATSSLAVATGWTHFVMSWDLSVPVTQTYVNGVVDTCANGLVDTNDTISYNTNQKGMVVGSLQGANFLTGDLADVYFDQANRLDLSVSANLQKFINGGNAVDLGTNCATPTGSQPIICMRGPVATWNNNVGSGGSFTIHAGSLSAASSNPP